METQSTIPQRIKNHSTVQTALRNKTAILYTRFSAHEQATGQNLGEQKYELERYCLENKIEVVGHFEDEANTNTFNRPAFQSLLKYLREHQGKVNYLLVSSWDRLSRNAIKGLNMIGTLKDFQVEVNAISIPESLLILASQSVDPEVEKKRRSVMTKAGIRNSQRPQKTLLNSSSSLQA